MRDIWERIDAWLNAHAPELSGSLQVGATEREILDLEGLIGAQLPEDVRASFLLHDGQKQHPGVYFEKRQELLCLKRIHAEWSIWKGLLERGDFEGVVSDPFQGIRTDWWNPRWIPLTYDGCGNHLCLDLDPSSDGSYGQIITMWHDDPERRVLAPDFRAWLASISDDLEQGKLFFSKEYDGLRRTQ